MALSRDLARVARRLADQTSERLTDRPTQQFIATVAGTSPLTVSWRGSTLPARRHAAYTPAAGDRVACKLIDGQIVVEDHIV